jgi:hypothetical protein
MTCGLTFQNRIDLAGSRKDTVRELEEKIRQWTDKTGAKLPEYPGQLVLFP